MSTNFYATIIPSEEALTEMQNLLIEKQLNSLNNLLNNSSKTYHIGKRSSGWQFLFCPHIKTREGFWNTGRVISPWEDTLESINEFLSREDVIIEDEYSRKYTSEEFWEEINCCLYNDPEHYINGEQYDRKQNRLKTFSIIDNFEYTTGEGLRFATTDDFS